jgi:hypothetical protein
MESSESAGKCQNIMYIPTARGENILFDEKVTSTIMKEYSQHTCIKKRVEKDKRKDLRKE